MDPIAILTAYTILVLLIGFAIAVMWMAGRAL